MKLSLCASALGAAFALGGCMTQAGTEAGTAGPSMRVAQASLRDAGGVVRAQSSISETGEGVRVSIQAVAMQPGAYGAHFHTTGRCDGPDFTSAGPHWNPTAQQHGKDNPQGMHKGDLPNLMVGADGRGSLEYVVRDAALAGGNGPILLDQDGAAIVVHATADDYRTDPSGNSGARVACGVIG